MPLASPQSGAPDWSASICTQYCVQARPQRGPAGQTGNHRFARRPARQPASRRRCPPPYSAPGEAWRCPVRCRMGWTVDVYREIADRTAGAQPGRVIGSRPTHFGDGLGLIEPEVIPGPPVGGAAIRFAPGRRKNPPSEWAAGCRRRWLSVQGRPWTLPWPLRSRKPKGQRRQRLRTL